MANNNFVCNLSVDKRKPRQRPIRLFRVHTLYVIEMVNCNLHTKHGLFYANVWYAGIFTVLLKKQKQKNGKLRTSTIHGFFTYIKPS